MAVKFTDEAMFEELRAWAKQHVEPVERALFFMDSTFSYITVVHRFGGWKDFCNRAGIKYRCKTCYGIPMEEVVAGVRRVHEKLGRPICAKDVYMNKEVLGFSHALFRNKGGTNFIAFCEKFNIPFARANSIRDEAIYEDFLDCFKAGMTLAEAGKALGLTRERARQVFFKTFRITIKEALQLGIQEQLKRLEAQGLRPKEKANA